MTGWGLEILLGHCIYFSLVQRDLMCIFYSTYRFIRKSYYEYSPIWDSVKDELRCFRGLMIFAYSDWSRQWDGTVYCVDSSLTGFGVITSNYFRRS